MFTVGNLKDSVSKLVQGLSVDNIGNKTLERAARILLQKADVPEASDKEAVTIYDGVYDYPISANIFGGALVDFRPQGNSRTEIDYAYKQPIELFDRTKHTLPNGYAIAFEYNNGSVIARIASPKPKGRAILDAMNATTGWTAGGSASSLTLDETVYYDYPASLRATLTGSSTGTLTKSITAQDLDTYEDVGVAFLAFRTPSIANLTSIALRIGSSATAYDEVTKTSGFLGAWTINEWTLVAFDMSASTSTGTPDWNAIDYVQVRFAHTGAITNIRVGGLWISLPSPHEMLYQTAAIFLRSGSISKTITDDNDEIVLSDSAYLLYEYECAIMLAEEAAGGNEGGVAEAYKKKLRDELYPMYRADNPSEELRTIGSYY